ncbi:hypothetical protein SNE40_017180 [Patella caerulea]|uniref:Ammonium transporter AmtB-like domain-containing protein n=1 Tax=Patella caerulea TaxID=87958 RepID=A0AAN8JEK1_PATCE
MAAIAKLKFPVVVLILQGVFLVLFALTVEYDDSADSKYGSTTFRNITKIIPGDNMIKNYYPMFQDVHVMIFVGFGFLMTFLKRYGFSAVGINMLIAAIVLQWATLVQGYLHAHGKVHISLTSMITADFGAATVLITFGAVLGKVSPIQMVFVAMLEVVFSSTNEWIGLTYFKVSDVGGSIFVHAFGAFFGLAMARVLYNEDVEKSTKEGSVYHSDIFSMVGTIFLWLFWPSFNSALAVGDAQQRAVLNTYMALASCCVVTFAISSLVDKDRKFDMVHIQNATLAGGVAVGTSADMMIQPAGALAVGTIAAILSTCGYKYVTPFLSSKLKLHDTCGVNNLHGMPAVMAAVVGSVASALATTEVYGYGLYRKFPAMTPKEGTPELAMIQSYVDVEAGDGRTAGEQAGYQMLALVVTLAIAIVTGIVTGIIIKFAPNLSAPQRSQLFEDEMFWGVPEDHIIKPNIPIIITPDDDNTRGSQPNLHQHSKAPLLVEEPGEIVLQSRKSSSSSSSDNDKEKGKENGNNKTNKVNDVESV